MKVELPVPFHVDAREKGYRTFYSHAVYVTEEFEIEELDPQDTPVAARGFDVMPGDGHGEVRFHDGRFWRPESFGDGRRAAAEDWSEAAYSKENPFAGWETQMLSRDMKHFLGGWHRPFNRDVFRAVETSTYDQEVAAMRSFLSDKVRAIGGTIYVAVAEPRFVIMTKDRFYGPIQATVAVRYGNPAKEHFEVFRLDRYDDLKAHLTDTFGEKSDAGTPPEILMPGAFSLRDEEISVLSRAASAVDGMSSRLKNLDAESGIAWYRLRDSVAFAKQEFDRAMVEATAERLREFHQAISAADRESTHTSQPELLAGIGLSRWDMRPLDTEPTMLTGP